MVAQANHQLSKYAAEIKFNTGDLFTNRENHRGRTPLGDLRSPLPKIHYYHNKRLQVKESQYLIPTYS